MSPLVDIQTPQNQLTTVDALQTTPVDKGDGNPGNAPLEIVGGLSDITQTGTPGVVSHHDILPVIDFVKAVAGYEPGSAAAAAPAPPVAGASAPAASSGTSADAGRQAASTPAD